jgi:insulysin
MFLALLPSQSVGQAELGAPGGLAYDLSFNKFGLRICFFGISQNISAYARRFCRRLVNHHSRMMLAKEIKSTVIERTILDANRQTGISPSRKRRISSFIRGASAQEVAREGKSFLASCRGALCLVQGDILPKEAISLVSDLKSFFDALQAPADEETKQPAVPNLSNILYKPFWRPRSASICYIPGVPLISDSCGRIPR